MKLSRRHYDYHDRPRSFFGGNQFSNQYSTIRFFAAIAIVAAGVCLLTWFLCYAKG